MALDVLAVSAMSDECEQLFSSVKILLSDHHSWLKMNIIEASKCFWAWYGPAPHKTFDDKIISRLEEEPEEQQSEKAENTGDTDGEESDVASNEENSQTGVLDI